MILERGQTLFLSEVFLGRVHQQATSNAKREVKFRRHFFDIQSKSTHKLRKNAKLELRNHARLSVYRPVGVVKLFSHIL